MSSRLVVQQDGLLVAKSGLDGLLHLVQEQIELLGVGRATELKHRSLKTVSDSTVDSDAHAQVVPRVQY